MNEDRPCPPLCTACEPDGPLTPELLEQMCREIAAAPRKPYTKRRPVVRTEVGV